MSSIQEYGELFRSLGLTEMVVEEGNLKLTLKKEYPMDQLKEALQNVFQDQPCNEVTAQKIVANNDFADAAKPTAGLDAEQGDIVKAPLLGIFYPLSGDKKAVVTGDEVKKGDVLCTIEAMKMMNEVKATSDGVIKEVCAKEGDLVEYNQKLFVIG